ncbi:hypothetical protein [Subtercola endophyticus]|uniref:hypothetical protein n=1 Tax=Subtercola endophyticus TaxID=2895559 RepID=UPI001E4B53B8|nr:hypothetical protein [Subtercola endophyticus]UFS58922.1 hypothetical protein LQ955_18325 [Subtercola endophyticus]
MPYATTGKTGDELSVVLVSGEDEMTVDFITTEEARYLAIKLIEMARKIDDVCQADPIPVEPKMKFEIVGTR